MIRISKQLLLNPKFYVFRPNFIEKTLKTKWCDLFVLGLMQRSVEFDLINTLSTMNTHLSTCTKFGKFFTKLLNFIIKTLFGCVII